MMLQKTDDLKTQIAMGKEIVSRHPELYKGESSQDYLKIINRLKGDRPLTTEELFYIATYNYWMYGFNTKEVFFYGLLDKSEAEKEEFISYMDRLNYTRHLNKAEDEHFFANKLETYQLLRDYYGRKVIHIDASSDMSEFLEFFSEHEEFMIKPMGLSQSIGVRKATKKEYGYDGRKAFQFILSEIGGYETKYGKYVKYGGTIIEEVIQQGEELARLHPASINSVRLTTIRCGNEIHVFYPSIRIGMRGEFICSASLGSIIAGINVSSGIVETDGYTKWNEHYVVHPDTGIWVKGIQIPKWDELCALAKELALRFDTLCYIGWDFAYTVDEKWVVIEGNENGDFATTQIPYQRGRLKELQQLIGWKSEKEYWWEGKYTY